MNSFSLQGRNAVVILGTNGLGRAIALGLAEAGANVALTYGADEDEAQAVAREIETKGRLAIALPMDAGDRSSVEAAGKEARSALGLLSVLADNDGADFASPRIFVPLLAESGNGAIVLVGGAQLRAAAQAVAQFAAEVGVRSNLVVPGMIQTDSADAALSSALGETSADILLKRKGMPEEVADAVIFLASDAASYIAGQMLPVDGGLSQ